MKKSHFKLLMLLSKLILLMILLALCYNTLLAICFIIYLFTLIVIVYVKNPKALLFLGAKSYDVCVAEKTQSNTVLIVCSCVLGVLCLGAAVNILDFTQGIGDNIIPIAVVLISYGIFIICCLRERRWYQRNVNINVGNIGDVLACMDHWEQDIENDTFVSVAECKDAESAHIMKDMLESKGLEVITFGENYPAYIGNVPVRVLVRKKDREIAEKYING